MENFIFCAVWMFIQLTIEMVHEESWRTLLKKHTYHNKLGSSCPCNMTDIGTEEILLLQHTVHRLSMVHLRMDVLCRIFHRRKIHHTYT